MVSYCVTVQPLHRELQHVQTDLYPQAICLSLIYNVANKLPFWTEVSQCANSSPSEKKKRA